MVEISYFTCSTAVRTLVAGHKMVAEGWELGPGSGGGRGWRLATAT